jgi:hypothetical protein
MTEAELDLSQRVEESLLGILRDAFPGVRCSSYSDDAERDFVSIGVRVDVGAENPIGTNMFDVSVEVEARNLDPRALQILADMLGNSRDAKETLEAKAGRLYTMPRGQAVEMIGAPRTVEEEDSKIVTYQLSATIQPL